MCVYPRESCLLLHTYHTQALVCHGLPDKRAKKCSRPSELRAIFAQGTAIHLPMPRHRWRLRVIRSKTVECVQTVTQLKGHPRPTFAVEITNRDSSLKKSDPRQAPTRVAKLLAYLPALGSKLVRMVSQCLSRAPFTEEKRNEVCRVSERAAC